MQTRGYVSSGVSVARSAAEGRGLEGFADGDAGVGAEGTGESCRLGRISSSGDPSAEALQALGVDIGPTGLTLKQDMVPASTAQIPASMAHLNQGLIPFLVEADCGHGQVTE